MGGIKEKVLAAHRAGIRRVLLPKRNEKDLCELHGPVKVGGTLLVYVTCLCVGACVGGACVWGACVGCLCRVLVCEERLCRVLVWGMECF